MFSYKTECDLLQDRSKTFFYSQTNETDDQPPFNFESLIEQVNSIYNSKENSFFIENDSYLIEFLDRTLYLFDKFLKFPTNLCFFQFFIFLLQSYKANDVTNDQIINEKVLHCSFFMVSLEYFIFNEYSEELLSSTFQYIEKNPLALNTSFEAIKYKQYQNVFLSSGLVDQIIDKIKSKKFEPIHFHFLSKYSKYLKEFVNPELLEKFQEIAIDYSKETYGFYFLSKLIKNFEITSEKIDEIIQFHLYLKSSENSMSLFRIFYCYSMNNRLDFFQTSNFFESFIDYFKSCELNMQIKWLDFIYIIAPTFSNELLPFLYHFIEISELSNFKMITKMCDILVICFQELDNEKVENQFINLETFAIFERILLSDLFKDYFKVIEILLHLKSVNKKLFFQTLYQTSIIDILENLIQNSDDDYVQKMIQANFLYLCDEYEEEDYDID